MTDTPPPETTKPKNKGGRPRGSKTRPAWLLKELKKAPKRPVGRPKGSKGLPKTLEGMIEQSLIPKPPPEKPKAPPHKRRGTSGQLKNPDGYFAQLKRNDPEKLRELTSAARRSPKRMAAKQTIVGTPKGLTKYEWALQQEEARKLTLRIMKIMDAEGSLPTNPIAREAMKSAIELLASDITVKDKLSAIRTLLEYNMQKPASTSNINVKTAEDFLDDIAENE